MADGERHGGMEMEALAALIAFLKLRDYRFVTPTPASHERVITRPERRRARDLGGIFGWSLDFDPDRLDAGMVRALATAGLIEEREGGMLRSRVRVSSLGRDLYVHSAFPTEGQDAVFFGPDSYRFARLIAEELQRCPQPAGARLVDIGTGAGVGAIVAGHLCPAVEIIGTDINPTALRFAHVNAAAAGVPARFLNAADLSAIDGALDLVLANPPYIIDEAGRAYRDGGGMHGGEVSLTMAQQAVPRLGAGGRFILYTGSAIVDGEDRLQERLAALAAAEGCALRYEELDPDVFGEELARMAYRDVDRIALVAAVIAR